MCSKDKATAHLLWRIDCRYKIDMGKLVRVSLLKTNRGKLQCTNTIDFIGIYCSESSSLDINKVHASTCGEEKESIAYSEHCCFDIYHY